MELWYPESRVCWLMERRPMSWDALASGSHGKKGGIFLDYVLSEPGLSARLAQVPYQSRLKMIPKNVGYCSPSHQARLPLTCYMAKKTFWRHLKRA
ncbi:hypothetical protein I314_03384 [Cryptococcus bacillisporus CA1873]|uniref:Uncharacterized protein n=1 Tax=Cryptococcus bacillisporus CA1873 TaxID=1296111 RepID=A0ABR5BAP6_CRYGA|nr:hypothetical protein I314_03384 [Cryptococcus bacillisporus CA1873]|eukprot:KIR62441.1 hypothetical protein I314_03384 [Cryptococcus gattii CA1873]